MTLVYHYDEDTKIYYGISTHARKHPRLNRYLVPRFSTLVQPPESQVGKYIKFNTETEQWYYEDIPTPEPEPESGPILPEPELIPE